jgi:hypothetical protein
MPLDPALNAVACRCCRQHVRASSGSSSSSSSASPAAAATQQQQQQQQQGHTTTFHHGITYTAYGGNSFHVKFNTTGEAVQGPGHGGAPSSCRSTACSCSQQQGCAGDCHLHHQGRLPDPTSCSGTVTPCCQTWTVVCDFAASVHELSDQLWDPWGVRKRYTARKRNARTLELSHCQADGAAHHEAEPWVYTP